MKPEKKDVAAWMATAGKTEKVAEFEYPEPEVDGFFVQIAFASRFLLNQIRQLARKKRRTDRRMVVPDVEERFDEGKLNLGYAERVVKDWKGLDVEKLENLIPGTVDAAVEAYKEAKKEKPDLKIPSVDTIRKTEVEYSVETAYQLLVNSVDFNIWVTQICGDTKNYANVAARKKEEYENLS